MMSLKVQSLHVSFEKLELRGWPSATVWLPQCDLVAKDSSRGNHLSAYSGKAAYIQPFSRPSRSGNEVHSVALFF